MTFFHELYGKLLLSLLQFVLSLKHPRLEGALAQRAVLTMLCDPCINTLLVEGMSAVGFAKRVVDDIVHYADRTTRILAIPRVTLSWKCLQAVSWKTPINDLRVIHLSGIGIGEELVDDEPDEAQRDAGHP